MRTSKAYNWHDDALCRNLPPQLAEADFFPVSRRSPGAQLAKQVCSACPVRQRCYDSAMRHDERHGIWAGTDERDRAWLRNPTMEILDEAQG